jgi:hypothetical protein
MRWPVEALGAEAVLYAGAGTADHARVAIQLLSKRPTRRTVYAHTGWRKIADDWVYLHAGGAIGAAGVVEGAEVLLPPELSAFKLELPSDSAAMKRATAASLRLLDVGPDRITVPAFGAIWRAILGGADFSTFSMAPLVSLRPNCLRSSSNTSAHASTPEICQPISLRQPTRASL